MLSLHSFLVLCVLLCSWLAAVVRQRVHLLSLGSHKLVHSLPPLAEPQPPITAIAFTADCSTLVVAASTHQIAAYSVQSGQPTEWTQQSAASLPAKLLKMPGSITSITSCPAAPDSLFLQSSEACCHLDMAQPLAGSSDAEGGQHGRKRRRPALKLVQASEPPGANCRMIYCADPVLYAAYLGPEALLVVRPCCRSACLCTCVSGWIGVALGSVNSNKMSQLLCVGPTRLSLTSMPKAPPHFVALQVERPWEEVYRSVAAPMYRHRYGT